MGKPKYSVRDIYKLSRKMLIVSGTSDDVLFFITTSNTGLTITVHKKDFSVWSTTYRFVDGLWGRYHVVEKNLPSIETWFVRNFYLLP